jgi:4-amino-4-deoxy-L-arabinose transferase-like glycosyltransferase
MIKPKKRILVYGLLLLGALSFRVGIATFLPNDEPEDGRVYEQMARNLLRQHVFSHATEPPYEPSLIRLPGYPFFLAAVYSVFGESNNTAVRVTQAVVDTSTCGLVALLAFYWEPDPKRKRKSSIAALVIAAVCPFAAIYVATILTETLTMFFAVATCVAATRAFRANTRSELTSWWVLTGVLAALAVTFRPDSGLFAAAIGFTLVITTVFAPPGEQHRRIISLGRALVAGTVFTLAFCLVLLPWTIRNWRTFHLFQPLAPVHAEMPGEFVPRGYLRWVRTWIDDEREIEPFIWAIDTTPVAVKDLPPQAFDSEEEKQRVTKLFDLYNRPQTAVAQQGPQSGFQLEEATPSPSPSPPADDKSTSDESDEGDDEEESDEENNQEPQSVEMTPEIDAGFGQIAQERIARSPFRYYVKLPLKRGVGLWFNTHSQYYPFEGELFAVDGLDSSTHQQIWLPLFTALIWIYTFLAVLGCWFLWQSGDFDARRFLLLTILIILFRIVFFAFQENPESRYVVELFPFVLVLGGIGAVRVVEAFSPPSLSSSALENDFTEREELDLDLGSQ